MSGRRVSILTAWIAISVLVFVTTLPGEEGDNAAPVAAERTTVEKAVEKALGDKKVSLDVEQQPLRAIIDAMRDQTNITIVLDVKALDDIGIGSDTAVTIKIANVSLRSALRLLFRRIDPNLSYDIRDEAWEITTQDAANSNLENRSLCSALSHLLQKIDPSLTYTAQDEVLMITSREVAEENLILMVYSVLDLVTLDPADKWDVTTYDFDSIIELIQKTIEPDSWDEVGGPGSFGEYPFCGALVIAQTMEIHDQIAALFSETRAKQSASLKQAQSKAEHKTTEHKPANKDRYVIAVYHLDEWNRPEKAVPVRPLVELIQEAIEPHSWQSDEVSIRILSNRLVVRQTKAVHQEIYKLLMKMNVLMEDAGFQSKAKRPQPRDGGTGFGDGLFGNGGGFGF